MTETLKHSASWHALEAYGCMMLWISLSAGVIMLNKYILDPQMGGFPFPLALTTMHMLFCSLVSWVVVRAGLVETPEMRSDVYIRSVLPIGALFSVTLWMGNAAYLYLSVSFIQMLKAVMPLLVYTVAALCGIEPWSNRTGIILVVVVAGVIIASYGEVVFVLAGFLCQCGSLLSEATRLTMVQMLLQRQGIKLSPITTMYYVSPVCLACLVIPFSVLEADALARHVWQITPSALLLSAVSAFGLNCAVYLLIGKTSALTMNVAGVAKDVLLVYLSMSLYGSIVTRLQVVGYLVALSGAFFWNYQKFTASQAAATKSKETEGAENGTVRMLLPNKDDGSP